MKYSILGFNQSKVTDTELDLTDLVILQYIQQACGVANMKHIMDENDNPMVWICHAKLSEDLPILRLSEGSLKNRLSKLKRNGYLESITSANEKGRGVRVYYRITELTTSFIYDMEITTSQNNDVKTTTTSQNNDMETERPRHLKVTSDNILSISDKSLSYDNQLNKSAEQIKFASAPIISIPLNDKTEFDITDNMYKEFCDLYPSVDIMRELRGMRAWSISNPKKKKTRSGVMRFINSWLSKAQDNGGNYNNNRSAQSNALKALEKINQAKIAGGN